MTTPRKSALPLPQPSLACIRAYSPEDVLTSWIAAQPQGRSSKETAEKTLAELFDIPSTLAAAIRLGAVCEDGLFLVAKNKAASAGPPSRSGTPAQDGLRAIAVSALSGPAAGPKRRRDLPALGLKQIFALQELPAWPTAQHARCALLGRIVSSFGGAFAECAASSLKPFKFDDMSRRMYLAFAGLQRGTVLQADAALLSKALGGPADTVQALTITIIRAAISAREPSGIETTEASDLESFTESIKRLASRLETKPYAGKVAIAQVYDAGLAEGLELGALDEFKARLAEAAREGLLDLERYDIAGPLDAGLRERSRLRLGRDERHFIVNQWI
ncbi:MAG: hypothetical protein WBX25_24290 [Rhodomicrobium sp.]